MMYKHAVLFLCAFIATNVYGATPMADGTYLGTSFSVQADGTVKTWGVQDYHSPATLQLMPATVSGLTGVTQVTKQNTFLKNNGTVWTLQTPPFISGGATQIGISNVQKITASAVHTIALKSDGTVWSWGDNQHGELGTGAISYSSPTPVQTIGLTGIIDIAAGGNSYSNSSFALTNTGTVWAWGGNYYGQFGNGSTCGELFCGVPTPIQVPGLSGVKAITSGSTHTVVLKNDGTVWVAGDVNGLNFTQVAGLNNITSIAAGRGSSMALKGDGTVWKFQDSPNPTASMVSGLSDIQSIQISDGGSISYAVARDGTIYDWGSGILGNGTTNGSSNPVVVGVDTSVPTTPSTGATTVPALSDLGLAIMGALLMLISFGIQIKKRAVI